MKKYARGRSREQFARMGVTNYYDGTRIDAASAVYVLGSDVLGPMGHELVPLPDEFDAKEFEGDHSGRRVLHFADITPAFWIRSTRASSKGCEKGLRLPAARKGPLRRGLFISRPEAHLLCSGSMKSGGGGMKKLEALIFDVDGTLADTERDGHRIAFNRAFAEAGLDWGWSVELYGKLLSVTGGKERILHYIDRYRPEFRRPADLSKFVADLHAAKTRHYVRLLEEGGIPLRPGVKRLLGEARDAGLRLAIATTTTPENVTALLDANLPRGASRFEVIGAGDIVPAKKPAPDIYDYVLRELGLARTAASLSKIRRTVCIPPWEPASRRWSRSTATPPARTLPAPRWCSIGSASPMHPFACWRARQAARPMWTLPCSAVMLQALSKSDQAPALIPG